MSSWSKIGKTIARNAPALGTALGGPLGGAIGSIVSAALGVEDTPEAVERAIAADPTLLLRMKEIESQHELEVMRAAYEAEATQQSVFASIYGRELSSTSWMARNWRPFFGFSVAVSFSLQMMGITLAFFFNPEAASSYVSSMGNLIPIWSVGLAVLGVNIDRRSKDKQLDAGIPVQERGLIQILRDGFGSNTQNDVQK